MIGCWPRLQSYWIIILRVHLGICREFCKQHKAIFNVQKITVHQRGISTFWRWWKSLPQVVDHWNSKGLHQNMAFLCQSSAPWCRTNFTFIIHSICLTIIYRAPNLCQVPSICITMGLGIRSLRIRKKRLGPFTTWQKEEEKTCPLHRPAPKKKVRWGSRTMHAQFFLPNSPIWESFHLS